MIAQPDIQVQSFCIILHRRNRSTVPLTTCACRDSGFSISSEDNNIDVSGQARGRIGEATLKEHLQNRGRLFLASGDASQVGGFDIDNLQGNGAAAQIVIDFNKQEISVCASLVGLPPVFYRQLSDRLIIASDIHLFTDIPHCSLSFNVESIRELTTIGYPIGGKTLFRGVKMVPAGHLLQAGAEKELNITRHWSLPTNQLAPSWPQFIEQQAAAFAQATENINVSESFLSLTAGMDTRAILAALTVHGIALPAYTMSGQTLSLDARTASKLCRAYDLDHTTVYLDNEFLDKLDSLSCEASRLTGGLASLTQAHEVYFYSKVGNSLSARLSGNLGNQVGRGGAENISLRNGGFHTFAPTIRSLADGPDLSHWYAPYLRSGGNLSFDFLLEQEIPFSSVGNYSLSNSFAAQQSPYADRHLIEISGNRPRTVENSKETSLLAMRIKDLRHRFMGESTATSFQRKFIKDIGGGVAEIPINWGARAKGGVSAGGVIRGMMALIDTAMVSKGLDHGPLHRAAVVAGISGVHEYRPYNRWFRKYLKEFTLDLFTSKEVGECGLFDGSALKKNAQRYFSGEEKLHKNITLSLDLALAAKTFNARL